MGPGPNALWFWPSPGWGTLICVHYTGAQPAPCPPPFHFVYPWELGTQPGWCGRHWELWNQGGPVPHCQPARIHEFSQHGQSAKRGRFGQDGGLSLHWGCRLETIGWSILWAYRSQILNQKTWNPRSAMDLLLSGGKLVRLIWASSLYIWQILKSQLSYTWIYGWLDII